MLTVIQKEFRFDNSIVGIQTIARPLIHQYISEENARTHDMAIHNL